MSAQAHETEAETRDLRAVFAKGAGNNLGDRHCFYSVLGVVLQNELVVIL